MTEVHEDLTDGTSVEGKTPSGVTDETPDTTATGDALGGMANLPETKDPSTEPPRPAQGP